MSWAMIGAATIGAGATLGSAAISKNKKGKGGTYQYQPYSGREVPSIAENVFRPAEQLNWDIISKGAQGIGVGYDPRWREENVNLLESRLGKNLEDQLRAAGGSVSASGLSGNVAAREALEGRARRDVGRTLGEGISQINIADLERQNLERDINRARLYDLNAFNFGQENNAANFDLNRYKAEQSLRALEAGMGVGQQNFNQAMSNYNTSNLTKSALSLAELLKNNEASQQTDPYKPGGMSWEALDKLLEQKTTKPEPLIIAQRTGRGLYS